MRLSLSQRQPVEDFRAFIQTDAPITATARTTNFGTFQIFGIAVCCSALVNRLIELGVTPNKTHTVVANPSVLNNRHFWRGVVDGDGSVGMNKRGQLVIYLGCASETLIRQFETFVKTHVETRATISQHSKNKHWRFQLTGKNAEKLAQELYRDARYKLKFNRLDEIEGTLHAKEKSTLRLDLSKATLQ